MQISVPYQGKQFIIIKATLERKTTSNQYIPEIYLRCLSLQTKYRIIKEQFPPFHKKRREHGGAIDRLTCRESLRTVYAAPSPDFIDVAVDDLLETDAFSASSS